MTGSQMAFILGVRGSVVMIRSPSPVKTSAVGGCEERVAIVDHEPQPGDAVTWR
jgi:hypothetical protein